jgi:hypothetical protein
MNTNDTSIAVVGGFRLARHRLQAIGDHARQTECRGRSDRGANKVLQVQENQPELDSDSSSRPV